MYGVRVDAAGLVEATLTAETLPPGYLDASAVDADTRQAIERRRRRWTGAAWVEVPRVTVPRPPAASLSDRQLLEAIARRLGLVG